ncbi:short-chain dehydrogenase/reductase family protein [Favolaschia claudopus]|uniref:Short-chain dehydrogenase/reductase family protein n=1 Tax=Favolaschia claudopus TaxID=2862362 RepID=A0AAW0DGB4_9AGAR
MPVRTILITGANQGLGMHTVHQLATTKDVLVFMGSRTFKNAEQALSQFAADIHPTSTVVPLQLDIADATSIGNAVEVVKKYLQDKGLTGLDVLINNAASPAPTLPESFAVNVFGTSNFTTAIRPLITSQAGSAILNISSPLGSLGLLAQKAIPVFPGYNISKTAMNALTLQWALEEEQKGSGVRVVSIDPGFNQTSLTKDAPGVAGAGHPRDGCKVMVEAALAREGKSGVFISKDGEVPW